MRLRENKKISKVIEGAVLGHSDKQIMADASIKARSYVTKVKRSYSDIVEARKRKYISMIDRETGGDIAQAKKLSQLMNAETDVYNFQGEKIATRPDHKIQLETVKYVDKVKGRETQSPTSNTQNNLFIQSLDKYTQGRE